MAAYYYNGLPMVAPFTFRSNQEVWTVEKRDKSIDRGTSSAQRWELDFGVVDTIGTVDNFLAGVVDVGVEDTMVMPQLKEVQDIWSADSNSVSNSGKTMAVNSTAESGSLSASVYAYGGTTHIPRGYFFKFASHSKIYTVTSDFDSGSSSTLHFFPALRQTVTNGDYLKVDSQALITYYKDDTNLQGITYNDGVLAGIGAITILESV